MTEHEFISQILHDREKFLDLFEVFVIDEAHELRKPQVVMLSILRNYLVEHPEKKVIITSATLESTIFKSYFEDFEVGFIQANTPTYGVDMVYNQYPDLETDVAENTVAHLKLILDINLVLISAHQFQLLKRSLHHAECPRFSLWNP